VSNVIASSVGQRVVRLLVVPGHWAEPNAAGSAMRRWPPALLSTICAGTSRAIRRTETATDWPGDNTVSNHSTGAFSFMPCWVVPAIWRPSDPSIL